MTDDMKGRPADSGAPPETSRLADRAQDSAPGERPLEPLLRRRRASLRCVPLPCGRRDPFHPPPVGRPTARELAAWQAAAAHLRALGCEPVIPEPVHRAWHCGCRCGAAS